MKKVLLMTIVMFFSCNLPEEVVEKETWSPVVVKKKYSENSVTKDLVFGTGNWHSTDYYIVDQNNKIWNRFSKEDYILCDVGDTLWTSDNFYLQMKK
jgi:hypothetical protein